MTAEIAQATQSNKHEDLVTTTAALVTKSSDVSSLGTISSGDYGEGSQGPSSDSKDDSKDSSRLNHPNSKKFSEHHLAILNEFYKENPNPTAKYLRKVAAKSGLTHLQCKAWFQYQRKKKRKNVLEHNSESLYKEIKLLVEDLEKAKERNVVLLTENNALRKNVNEWTSYQDQISGIQGIQQQQQQKAAGPGAIQEAKPVGVAPSKGSGKVHPASTLQLQDASPTSEQTHYQQQQQQQQSSSIAQANAAATATVLGMGMALPFKSVEDVQAALLNQQSATTAATAVVAKAATLDVNNVDVPGQISLHASDQVKKASAVVTRILQGELKNQNQSHAMLHSEVAVHVRTLIFQSENPLDIVNVIVKSFEATLASGQKTDAQKEAELKPLLDSFMKTELAIKDAQLATKTKLMAQLPQLPPAGSVRQKSGASKCPVSTESMMCLLNMCYLGAAERSLCLMGETSLYALFIQAYNLINLENVSIPFEQIMLMHKLRDELKKGEEQLVKTFEATWRLPYAFAERHHDPMMRTHLQNALMMQMSVGGKGGADQANHVHALMSKTMTEAVNLYKEGIAKCCEKLPPLLAARIVLTMHKVKQILRTADSFYQVIK